MYFKRERIEKYVSFDKEEKIPRRVINRLRKYGKPKDFVDYGYYLLIRFNTATFRIYNCRIIEEVNKKEYFHENDSDFFKYLMKYVYRRSS